MKNSKNIDYPVRVADGIYWVGSHSQETHLYCNPYLIVADGQAVLIDGGSRSDFAKVMMNILQVGIDPKNITALIYQHYDPDLCGSMGNLIDICDNPDLRVLSTRGNNTFISFYIHKDRFNLMENIEDYGNSFTLNNRTLRFISTPYSHNEGSFVTFDVQTRTLFSSDLFGSFYYYKEDIFFGLEPQCYTCKTIEKCPNGKDYCPILAVYQFHRKVMPCEKALHYAIRQIRKMEINTIAPQHGNILSNRKDIDFLIDQIGSLDKVGIDGII
uniref:MBL fold metallo-hydrolase n=1 Tax=Candidatus Electrothrix sp. TaxID=2170559 RepID=UPI0040576A69